MEYKRIFGKTAVLFLVMTVVCGLAYTLAITGISQICFKDKANGSMIEIDGVKYGSELLGQRFTDPAHMWGRIVLPDVSSYTDDDGTPLMYAGASNKSPAADEFAETMKERVAMIKAANPDAETQTIPVELVTCSGSGLDPDISPAAAEYQVPRLAKENGMSEDEVRSIIKKYSKGKFLGILGEETVNVLKVNLALEGILKE
ncbi:potassium-transporting ATPase subunit KdpC [Clostridium sp. AM58-1XD]|nr:potassium-transporting ATPase subunit KdpC [Clostridium sp. AM58-1XD]RGZ00375.1 potassium-transporting ATPase subunit KdpC [Clostridium sp. AM58-1XD]